MRNRSSKKRNNPAKQTAEKVSRSQGIFRRKKSLVKKASSKEKTAASPAAKKEVKAQAAAPVPPPVSHLTGAEVSPPQTEFIPHETVREAPSRELPERYGDNQIYLMVRDPYWIFAYWEIQGEVQEKAFHSLGGDWGEIKSILRVYETTDHERIPSSFDMAIAGMARDWYVQVLPNRSYVVEIGLLHRDGRFITLARSNEVTTPRDGMSDVLDENWMGIDFDRIYALSGGFQVGKSSLELRKLMQERLKGAISSGSGAIGSVPRVPAKKKGFSFNLDCELIVYGATEPDASVTIQGRKIELKPDGTFNLRFALPDTRVVVDAKATSADGREERSIIPIVERRTRRPAPTVKQKEGLRS